MTIILKSVQSMKKSAQILMLFAVLSALKLPWFMLQVVAWGGMFANYSQQMDSWGNAIQMTFDQEYRCAICKSLDIIHEDLDSDEQLASEGEITLLLPNTQEIRSAMANTFSSISAGLASLASRSNAPPAPPPRPISA